MRVYLLLLIVVFILLLVFAIYLVRLTHNYLNKRIKNKLLCWIISFIPLLLIILGLWINMVNAIVVYIHLIVFILLIKLILLIIKKKKVSEYIIFACGVLITTIYLSYGYYMAHHVVETNYVVYTDKNVNAFRIVQLSDSHIGTTFNGEELLNYVKEINKLNPDIVAITGDLIDDSTKDEDIVSATKSLGKLNAKYGVYFVYGNHDKGYFSSKLGILSDNLQENNVMILEDASTEINNIIVMGRRDAGNKDRIEATELTKELDKNKYIIMLDHQPTDYDNEVEAGADLVLSGHTHGGQLFPLGQFGLLLGANDMLYGMKKIDNTAFVVNSGISDWAIKFKTGTKSEYVVIDVKTK